MQRQGFCACEAESRPRELLCGAESPFRHVGHCEMCHVYLARTPRRYRPSGRGLGRPGRRRGRGRLERHTEECQLEPEALSPRAVEITGHIPPLLAESRVGSMIERELEAPR